MSFYSAPERLSGRFNTAFITKRIVATDHTHNNLGGGIKASSKKMKGKPYDELIHLRMDLHTESGVVSIEKNEVVTIEENPKTTKNAETMEVKKFLKNMTLRNMLELTSKI